MQKKKCASTEGDVDSGEVSDARGRAEGIQDFYVLSAQFSCGLRTALKNMKAIFFLRK